MYNFYKWINERKQIYVFYVPALRSPKSAMIKRLPMHEKPPIWELFFAPQNLWSQHFLHPITHDISGPIYVLNNKTTKKN